MFTKKKVGDLEVVEPTAMNPDTKEMLTELLGQNRAILESNIRMIDVMSRPILFVNDDKEDD